MEFLEQADSFYIKMGVIIVIAIGYFFVARKNNLKLTLQYLLYSYGIMMLLLSLTIPHIFPGYPDDIQALENKKKLFFKVVDHLRLCMMHHEVTSKILHFQSKK